MTNKKLREFKLTSSLPIFPVDAKSVHGDYEVVVQCENVSDGYHTMHELYQHRMALNVALFNLIAMVNTSWDSAQDTGFASEYRVMKAKQHFDGTMFEDYFIVMLVSPEGQISYHYRLKYWDLFKIPEVERTPEWDKHGSLEVMRRLEQLI